MARQTAAGYDFIKKFPRFEPETYRTLIEAPHEQGRLTRLDCCSALSISCLLLSFSFAGHLHHPASISINNCPGEHHDFDFMGASLPRMTIDNGATERPQSADSPKGTLRSSFCTLWAGNICP